MQTLNWFLEEGNDGSFLASIILGVKVGTLSAMASTLVFAVDAVLRSIHKYKRNKGIK